MGPKNNEVLNTFLDETSERLVTLEKDLGRLENEGMDPELINSMFRDAHSMKSTAGLLGLKNIELLAHRMETILDLIRNHRLSPSRAIAGVLLESLDKIGEMVDNVEVIRLADISPQLKKMEQVVQNAGG